MQKTWKAKLRSDVNIHQLFDGFEVLLVEVSPLSASDSRSHSHTSSEQDACGQNAVERMAARRRYFKSLGPQKRQE
eukprot:6030853-Amphidinium_carterae.1